MKIKSWQTILKAFAVISLVLTVFLVSCIKTDVKESEEISLFSNNAGSVLSSSLIDMPKSLLIVQEQDTEAQNPESMRTIEFTLEADKKKNLSTEYFYNYYNNWDLYKVKYDVYRRVTLDDSEADNASEYASVYDIARNYVGVAKAVRDQIHMFLNIVVPGLHRLKGADLPLVLPDYLVGKFGLHKIVVSVSEDPDYKWQVSLYYSDRGSPDVAFFLSITDGGGKGRMFMYMEGEEDEYAKDAGIDNIKMSKKIEAVFDGTQNPKKFEITYIGDRSEAREYAKAHWSNLDDNAKDALTKIPDKIFLTLNYDDILKEFEVSGASYHPGWSLLKELSGQALWYNPNRTVYMFKAKVAEDKKGTKLAVALPEDTTEHGDFWDDDSIGTIFGEIVRSKVHSTVINLADNIDTTDEPIYLGDKNSERVVATVIYDCLINQCTMEGPRILPDNGKSGSEYRADLDAIQIPIETLRAFAGRPVAFEGETYFKVEALRKTCSIVNYVVNPVFFGETSYGENNTNVGGVLLGTYNTYGENAIFYEYTFDNTAKVGSFVEKPVDRVHDLIGISLENIGSYIPSQVKKADINF